MHVPKTGGSTFVGLLKDSIKIPIEDQKLHSHVIDKVGNVRISHIDFTNLNKVGNNSNINFIKENKILM